MNKNIERTMQAVVFDMDGVILDTEKMYLEVWIDIGNQLGLKNIEIPAKLSIGVTWEETKQLMFDHLGGNIPFALMEEMFFKMAEERLVDGKVELKPGISSLLEYLRNNNYKIGLASSSDRYLVEGILNGYNLMKYFDILTCGDEVVNSKPSPEIYQKACKNLCVDPQNAYAIEDSFNGIRSASGAGMTAIMVPDLIMPDQEMKEKAEIILTDLYEVERWIADRDKKTEK